MAEPILSKLPDIAPVVSTDERLAYGERILRAAIAEKKRDDPKKGVSMSTELSLQFASANSDALLGKSRRKELEKFGKRRGAEIHKEREQEHEKWKNEARKVMDKSPSLKNKSEVSRRVKKQLGLVESENTVRDVLFPPNRKRGKTRQ